MSVLGGGDGGDDGRWWAGGWVVGRGLVWTMVKNWVVVERPPRDVRFQLRAACEKKVALANLTRLGADAMAMEVD